MAVTYEPIGTTTLSSAAATITFSSIPATYTDLKLIIVGTNTTSGNTWGIRFNSDSGNNYSYVRMTGTGSAATTNTENNQSYISVSGNIAVPTSTPFGSQTDIFSYAGSTFKTVLLDYFNDQNGSGNVERRVSLWRNTAAITNIEVFTFGGNLNTETTATLYGILRA